MADPFWTRHRGPYILHVCRPGRTAGQTAGEWLAGTLDGEDVEAEARALLADPRDSIQYVAVWSESEQCFVGGYGHAA
jgi:hypothetical protein